MMRTTDEGRPTLEEPHSELERQLITTYLAQTGHSYHALIERTDDEARRLLADATLYASERLSEIEARSHYVHELHGES
jgi:hypothetical protein